MISHPAVSRGSLGCRLRVIAAAKRRLFIEPNILHAPAIEQAVNHDRQSFQLGSPAGREAVVVKNRSSTILLQFLVDFPNEISALLLILPRSTVIEKPVDFGITKSRFITV